MRKRAFFGLWAGLFALVVALAFGVPLLFWFQDTHPLGFEITGLAATTGVAAALITAALSASDWG